MKKQNQPGPGTALLVFKYVYFTCLTLVGRRTMYRKIYCRTGAKLRDLVCLFAPMDITLIVIIYQIGSPTLNIGS